MKLTSTRLTIPVERDGQPVGEITFDPQDVSFAEGFYELLDGMTEREKAFSAVAEGDARGRLRCLGETCRWMVQHVEHLFGTGSAEVLFGGQCSPELLRQFFDEVEPIIVKARGKRTAKYRAKADGVLE